MTTRPGLTATPDGNYAAALNAANSGWDAAMGIHFLRATADGHSFGIELEALPAAFSLRDGEDERHLEITAEKHLIGNRTKKHDEDGREDEPDQRQQQLDRRLVGQFFRPLRPFDAHLRGKYT